jgi:hypothetical protein
MEEEVRASLKTADELEKLESKEKTADWVKAKESAREKILAAGHTGQSLDRLIELARVEYNKKPLGKSRGDANKDRAARGKEKNRNILAGLDNNTI